MLHCTIYSIAAPGYTLSRKRMSATAAWLRPQPSARQAPAALPEPPPPAMPKEARTVDGHGPRPGPNRGKATMHDSGVNMKPRISMITLGVRDLARAVQFYEQGLGWPRRASPPEVAFFPLQGSWLALFGRDALAADAGIDAAGSGFAGFSLAHNVASEAEADAVMARALAAGATLLKPAQKTAWGGYAGYFADPDGYLWEVAHNPQFWVGPADAPG